MDPETTLITDASQAPTEGASGSVAGTPPQGGQGDQPQGEQKPGEQGQQGEQKPGEQGKDSPPADYTFTFAEGKALEGEHLDFVKGLAKELGLSQDQAQKLADKAISRGEEASARQVEMVEAAKAEWAGAVRADKEIGGDALDANLGIAKKALQAFGTPELTALLNESGLGNHPEIIRAFYRAGKAISEDGVILGGQGGAQKGDARRLYPNSNLN